MKFDQVIEHNKRNNFPQKSCRKWGRETSSRPLFVFLKSFKWGKSKWSGVGKCWTSPELGIQWKETVFKTSYYWFKDMLNFTFLEKSFEIVSAPYFLYDFSRKMSLMLYSINWPNFIVWLILLLEILFNVLNTIVSLPGCNVLNFEIDLIFLIKPFFA